MKILVTNNKTQKVTHYCENQYYIAIYNTIKRQKNIPLWLCQHALPPEQEAGIFPQAAEPLGAHRAFFRCAFPRQGCSSIPAFLRPLRLLPGSPRRR